jgi:hypothetical protein
MGIGALAETNNTGLSLANGRYISILEGDDCWEPDKLRRQFDAMEHYPDVVVAWGRAVAMVSETQQIQRISPPESLAPGPFWPNRPAGSILNVLYLENIIPAVTITIRKSTLVAAGGFQQPSGFPTADLPTLVHLALMGAFFFDDNVLGKWRVYSGQITKMYPVEMAQSRWGFIREHARALQPSFKKVVKLSVEEIDCHFKNRLMIAYATSGRYRLMRKEFREARKDYLKAIFFKVPGNQLWRLRAIIGYLYSLFHRNVEGLSRKLGKISYQE